MSAESSFVSNKLTERHIQETCSAYLALDGWRRIRTDIPHLRGLGVSEKGMADDQYVRYRGLPCDEHSQSQALKLICSPSKTETMWIEWKRKGGKAGEHQAKWHAAERARGALTLIAGEDFPSTIEGFCQWYVESGLQRKRIGVPK